MRFDENARLDTSGVDDPRGSQAYVMAHEYGHHIQNLLGTNRRVGDETGPASGSVRLELQTDCYAGVWAQRERWLRTGLDTGDVNACDTFAARDLG